MNGYTQKENGLPTGYTYGTIGVASIIQFGHSLANLNKMPKTVTPVQVVAGFALIPFAVGTFFCLGNYMGKSARHATSSLQTTKLSGLESPSCSSSRLQS